MVVTHVLRGRGRNQQFKVIFHYLSSSRPAWDEKEKGKRNAGLASLASAQALYQSEARAEAQLEEGSPCMHEVLGSIPGTV